MAFTKIVGAGIHTLSNVHTHNINSSGIITATQFVGIFTGTDGNFSGNVSIGGSLTVNGDFTTLNTTLREVEILNVDANSSTTAGIITQRGSGDILNLFDNNTEVFTVTDGGNIGIGTTIPISKLEVTGNTVIGIVTDKANYSNTLNVSGNGLGVTGARALNIVDHNAVIKVSRTHDTYGSGVDFQHWNPDISTMYGRGIVGIESSSMYLMNTTEEGYIYFNTTPSGGTHTERARITSDGHIGIGITNPSSPLQVVNSADASIRIFDNTGVTGDLSSSGWKFRALAGNAATNANGLVISHGTTERIHITPAGNVGIGSDSTGGARLRVYDNGAGTLLQQWRVYLGSTADQRALNLYSPATDSFSDYFTFDTGNAIKFKIDSTNVLCLKSDYKVGIGTDDPQKQLQILGDADTCLRITSSAGGVASLQLGDTADTVKGGITFKSDDNSLRIRGNNNADRIVIASGGNVGINTSSFSGEKFAVLGNVKISNLAGTDAVLNINEGTTTNPLRLQQTATEARIQTNASQPFNIRAQSGTGSTSYLAFWTKDSERLRITPGGDLIHTSNDKTLSLVDTRNVTNAGTKIAFFGANRYDTDEEFAAIRGGLTSNSGGSGKQNGYLEFIVGAGSHKVRITDAGKVGIGTDAPETLLQIVGSTASAASSGGTLGIRQKGDSKSDGITLTSSHANSARFWKDSDGALHIYNTGGNVNDFVLTNAGNVGIGTNTPAAVLHVEKDGTSQILARFESNMGTNNNRHLSLTSPTSDSSSLPFTFSTGNSIQFKCDTHIVHIDEDGRLGIGTETPSHELDIESSSPVIEMKDNDAGDSRFQIAQSGAQTYFDMDVGDLGSSSLRLRFGGDERFRFTTGGSLGINTDNPTRHLQIGGSSVDSDNVIRLGKRIACSNTNLPLIGHHTGDGTGSGLALCSTSNGGHIHFFTGNGSNGFGHSANSERLRIGSSGEIYLGTTDWPTGSIGKSAGRVIVGNGGQFTVWNETNSADGSATVRLACKEGGDATKFGFANLRGGTENTSDQKGFFKVEVSNSSGSGIERLRITSSGKVGIGTDNPGHILDLYNADGTDCLRLNVSTATGGSNKQNAIRFSVDGTVKAHMGVAVDAGKLISASSANDFCLKTNQASDILLAPNGSVGLRIKSDGNINIANTLFISDTVAAEEATSDSGSKKYVHLRGNGIGGAYANYGDNRSPKPHDFARGRGMSCIFTTKNGDDSGGYGDGMHFSTYYDSSGGAPSMLVLGKSSSWMRYFRHGWDSSTDMDDTDYSNASIYDVTIVGASDERAKEEVVSVASTTALSLVSQLRPVTYKWTDEYINDGGSKNEEENQFTYGEPLEEGGAPPEIRVGITTANKVVNIGFIAQEVEKVIPTVVHQNRVSIGGTTDYWKNIDYDKLVPYLTGAIQELKAQNDALKKRLDDAGL